MASIVQDPPTYAKVIIKTTHGELDIELWTKEMPIACRNFIQLCLEQYYDNCIFHRLIPGFMIQTGDPEGTGEGGDSIYDGFFKDEFNQRIKFSHRGRVAMANFEKPNTNLSQFFITFDACHWLDKKHTIFGKVMGETIYNLLNMQSQDTDAHDRPVNPPKILSTQVVINPFDDIVPRNLPQKLIQQEVQKDDLEEQQTKKTKKQKSIIQSKNRNLLSFEDEEQDEQEYFCFRKFYYFRVGNNNLPLKGIKSSHDVGNHKKLSNKPVVDLNELENPEKNKNSKNIINSPKPRKQVKTEEIPKNLKNYKTRLNKKTGKLEIYWPEKNNNSDSDGSSDSGSSTPDEEYVAVRQTQRNLTQFLNNIILKYSIVKYQLISNLICFSNILNSLKIEQIIYLLYSCLLNTVTYENEELKKIRQQQKQEYENLKIDFLKFKGEKLGTNNADERSRVLHEKKLLSNLEKRKGEVKKEQEKLDKLDQFRKELNNNEKYSWTQHNLKFLIDSQRAYQVQKTKEKIKEYKMEDDDFSIVDGKGNRKPIIDRDQVKLKDIMTVDELIKITNEVNNINQQKEILEDSQNDQIEQEQDKELDLNEEAY